MQELQEAAKTARQLQRQERCRELHCQERGRQLQCLRKQPGNCNVEKMQGAAVLAETGK